MNFLSVEQSKIEDRKSIPLTDGLLKNSIHSNVCTIQTVCLVSVTITTPPENTTVCRGSDVTISCGYNSTNALPVTWIINGTSFSSEEIVDSPLYWLNDLGNPKTLSLTVSSINGNTTFQCIVHSNPTTISTLGMVTVTTGTYICMCSYIVMYSITFM